VADIGVPRAPIRSCLSLLALFAFLLLAFALLERIGVESGFVPEAVIFATLGVCSLAALFAPGYRPVDYYAAGRAVPAALGGMGVAATAAGLLVIGLAAGVFGAAAEFVLSGLGLLFGLALAAVLFAPGLRRFGGYTAADFLTARFGGLRMRLAAALVAFVASFLVFAAQLKTAAALLTSLVGLDPSRALHVATGLAVVALLPGGMRSLTWARVLQYCVSAIACLAPAAFLAGQAAFAPEAGQAAALTLQELVSPLSTSLALGEAPRAELTPFLLAFGVAALPPVLAHAASAATGRDAGLSFVWAFLSLVVLIAAGLILGQSLGAVDAADTLEGMGDLLGLALPVLAALPSMLAGLLMAGALAALFATGQAALFSAATALSRDVWESAIDRGGPAGRRIVAARLIVVAVAMAAAWLVPRLTMEADVLLGWGMAFAAAGTFAPLMLGIWWRRANTAGALAGSLAGFGLTALALLLDSGLLTWSESFAPEGIGPSAAAAIAVPAGFLSAVAASLLTSPPTTNVDVMLAALHASRDRELMRERPA
jgi:cation/acetate symporter